MSDKATQSAEPVARAAESTRPQVDNTGEVVSAGIDVVGAARVAAGGGDGLSALRRFPTVHRHQTLLALQRTHGNTAVQRLLAGDRGTAIRRHASEELGPSATAIQRHTSTVLEEPENAIKRMPLQRAVIQRDLASELSDAVSGIGTDEDAIFAALDAASADAKRAVLNNPGLIADLRGDLSGTDLGMTMVKLGQPLADQIDYAISGDGTDDDALFYAIESSATPDEQRRLVTRNPELMVRLRDDLSQEDAGRAMRGLKASLTEQLYAAVEGAGTDEAGILAAINAAPADQKLAALHDRALMERLTEDQNTSEMLDTLKALGASLADRLNMAMDGLGTDEDAIYAIAEEATAPQRREILGNSALMARLRDELTQPEMLRALTSLGGSLADMLMICLDDDVDSAKIVSLLEGADDTQKAQVRENTALVGRLQAGMPEESYAQVCELIGLHVPGAEEEIVDAGDTGDAGTNTGDAGTETGDAGTAGETAEPEEPTTLVGKVSAALDEAPPNGAGAIAAISTAAVAERATVGDDTALRERLYAALDQPQLLQVMTLLGVGIASRLATLIARNAAIADIQAHITVATAYEKRAVLDDRVLIERLVEYAGETQRTLLLAALGDTLGNQIDQLLAGTPTLAALKTMISAATEPQRQEIAANVGLMGRIAGAFTSHEYFRIKILLIYGSEAAFPAPVTALIAALAGVPTLSAVRTPIGNLPDADLAKVKVAIREYMRPLLNDADFGTLGRMLDQGLIVDETIDEDWNETLQIGDASAPGTVFTPQTFTGNRGFDVGYYRDRVQVTVRLQFSTPTFDFDAKAALPGLMTQWEAMIEAAWDNKFSLRNAVRTLPIRIDMVYNSGTPHHHVNVGSAVDVSWPGYNTANWYYQAKNYDHTLAPLHEFGHMLGNPDEYNLSPIDFQNTVGTAPTAGNATTVTDSAGNTRHTHRTSLMGGGGTVEGRHLNYFTNWLNKQRLPGEPAYTLV
ncbi:MAG: hypothetical protein QOF01_306 [Thermomicrobiales bacterium]|nr:hypothetical protein [Thermomicrobiales bacterium]